MLPDMLYIFLPLVLGYFILITKQRILYFINQASSILVYVILTLMGLSLAALDDLALNINQILRLTCSFFICISVANLTALLFIDKLFKTPTRSHKPSLPILAMVKESVKLLVIVAIGFVIGLLMPFSFTWVEQASETILMVLLFFIGIQLRNSGITLKQIVLNKKGLTLAAVLLSTSLLGGLLAAWLLEIPLNYGLAMASGFGWYSLAGILIGDTLGPVYGGASFLLELTRELVAIVLIPILITRYPLTAIGYSGATAMDFTLPIIQTSGGASCVPIAIVSGFILSLLVPVLILFFVAL